MSGLTVFSVIRDGVRNGYPFVEAYGSWFGYCDRLVVVDGESSDGTDVVLAELARIEPRFSFVSRPWPQDAQSGTAIAQQTNAALALASDGARRLMYIQADEIYTVRQRRLIEGWTDGAVEFRGCINFWNSLDTVVANDFPMRYVRALPAGAGARSIGDGYSFDPGDAPVTPLAEDILHYGWCFPVNILQKHLSHAALYSDIPSYRMRGRLARLMLARRNYDRELLDALVPDYRPVRFTGEHPECMRHLIGADVYDPYVGLELLAGGVHW